MGKIIPVALITSFMFTFPIKAEEIANLKDKTDEKPVKVEDIKRYIVSFSGDNVPLKMVLYSIIKNTPYNIIFASDVDSNKTVTLNFKDINLKDALETIMDITDLDYEIRDRIIYVKGTVKKVYKLPYIKTVTSYNSSLGGNVTGGGGSGSIGSVGTSLGGGVSGGFGGGINGEFNVDYSIDQNNLFTQIEDNLKNILSKNGKYTLNKMTGVLVVEDTKDRIKLIEEYLTNLKKEIDKQVLIEAKVLEVSLNDGYSFGIDWNKIIAYPSVVYSQSLSISNSVSSVAVLRNGDTKALISAISTYGNIKTLSNPRVLAMNNQPAILTSGRIIPFWTKQVNIVGAGINNGISTTYPIATYVRRDILDGITLGVTPHIEDNGDIILNIVPISTS
ncbi:MAG: secretin and TonB N-terminal domain-containing protein, partial [Sulfurihydrogenibium sp.]|nr:secretin and TonB N-terminal domain-containing protein [Sulfurihydrogenibium sp.]